MATSGFVHFWDSYINPDGPVVYLAPAASETIELNAEDQIVRVTTPASGAGVLKLPSRAEAAGRMYSFTIHSDGGGEVQVVDDTGTDLVSDNLGAAGDYMLYYCDGFMYYVVKENTN